MIIVRIHGGLGNQLFQYSFASYLKHKNSLLNITFERFHFNNEIDRPLSISNFNLSSFKLVNSNFNKFDNPKINKIYNLLFNHKRYLIEGISDISDNYINNILPDHKLYFDGYWQKLKIVNEIEDKLRKEIVLKFDLSFNIVNYIELISSQKNSVSVHIRKTDFISTEKNKSIFSECTVNYYYSAIEYILNHISRDVTFFIFSDDFDWVKANLRFNAKHFFVEGNFDFEDLYLMSICNHNITANSTFSWWGAWLNSNKNKVVVTPEKWFENGNSEKDLIPYNWIKIIN